MGSDLYFQINVFKDTHGNKKAPILKQHVLIFFLTKQKYDNWYK